MSRARWTLFGALVLPLFFIFLLPRAALLDADLPRWDKFEYQPIDEGYYAITALNLFRFGSPAPELVATVVRAAQKEDCIGNLATFLAMVALGNNYEGFRGGILALSVFAAIFFVIVSVRFSEGLQSKQAAVYRGRYSEPYRWGAAVLASLLLSLTPSFILTGIVNEPTGPRLFGIACLAFAGVVFLRKKGNSGWRAPVAFYSFGFTAGASVFLIYPYNFFLIPAAVYCVLLALFFEPQSGKLGKGIDYKLLLSTFCAGIFSSYLMYLLWSRWAISGESIVANSLLISRIWPPRPWLNLRSLFGASFLRDNPIFALIAAAAAPISLQEVARSPNAAPKFLAAIACLFVMQSLLINDYPLRKDIVLFPFSIWFLIHGLSFLFRPERLLASKAVLPLLLSLGLVLLLWRENGNAWLAILGTPVGRLAASLLGIFSVGVVLRELRSREYFLRREIELTIISIGALGALVIPAHDAFQLWRGRTYGMRDCLMELGKMLPASSFVFGLGHGFSIYGDWTPIGQAYVYRYVYPRQKWDYDVAVVDEIFPDRVFEINIACPANWAVVQRFPSCAQSVFGGVKYERSDISLCKYQRSIDKLWTIPIPSWKLVDVAVPYSPETTLPIVPAAN